MAPTSGHLCPALCDPQRHRSQKRSEVGRCGEQESGLGPLGQERNPSTGRGHSLPTVLMAPMAASSHDPDGRKRKCGLSLS